MPLLQEMVRYPFSESTPYNDASTESVAAVCDWTTKKTYTLVLAAPLGVYISAIGNLSMASSAGNLRVTINGIPAMCTGYVTTTGDWPVLEGYFYLLAGNNVINFDVSCVITGGGTLSVKQAYVKTFSFADHGIIAADSGNIAINNETKTIINIVAPFISREIPIGTIKQYCVPMNFVCFAVDDRRSVVHDVGTGDTASRFNWKLYIDGVQVAWTAKADDYGSVTQPTFAEGARGYYIGIFLSSIAGTSHTIRVDCTASGIDGTVRCRMLGEYTPWMNPGVAVWEPITVDIPQFSTIYMILEPFSYNNSKTISIGALRAWDFTCNYYYTLSGVGLLYPVYRIEIIDPSQLCLYLSGAGSCVGAYGVDTG